MPINLGYIKKLEEEKKKLESEKNNINTVNNNFSQNSYSKNNNAKSSWFDSGAFSDGYQFGDVTKTVLGTVGDVGSNLLKGVVRAGEGIGDLAAYGGAQIVDWLGNKEYADQVRQAASEDLTGKIFSGVDNLIEPNSVLGTKSQNVVNSIGNMYAQAITSAKLLGSKGNIKLNIAGKKFNLPTTSIISGASSGIGEAYQKGAEDWQAWLNGAGSGLAEGISESLFGTFGLGGSDLDDFIVKSVTKNMKSGLAKSMAKAGIKATGEGVEEVASYLLNYGSKQALDLGKNTLGLSGPNLAEKFNSEELWENFFSGALAAAIGGLPSTISEVRGNKPTFNVNEGFKQNKIAPLNVQNSNFNSTRYSMNDNLNLPVINSEGNLINPNRYQYVKSDNAKIDNLRKSASQYFNNSQETQNLINTVEKVISDKDYNVTFDNTLKNKNGNSINAQITTNKNGEVEIKINPNSNRAGEFLLVHEITHAIETDSMKKLVLDYASKNSEFNTALESLKQTYGVNDVSSEVVADISGQLLGNQEFINSLAMQNTQESKTIIRKIYEGIRRVLNNLTENGRYRNFVQDLETKWRDAYRNTISEQAVNNISSNTQYHISQNASIDIDNVLNDINERNPVRLRDYTPDILVQNGIKNLPMYENPSHIRKNILTAKEAQNLGLSVMPKDHYHGLGKDLYLKAIDSLDDPRVIFKNKNNKDYLILTVIKDQNNNNIIVPIEIETKTDVNKISVDINRVKSVYGYDRKNPDLNKYIKDNIKNNSLIKIYEQKKQSTNITSQSAFSGNNITQSDDNVKLPSTKYSMQNNQNNTVDSQGRELSREQQEFFKDSKVRDKNGNLLTVYHGTKNDFTIFDINKAGQSNGLESLVGFWFTENEKGAKQFSNEVWYGENENAKAMEVYLNLKKPKIYENVDNTKKINNIKNQQKEVWTQLNKYYEKYNIEFDFIGRMEPNNTFNNISNYTWHSDEELKEAITEWAKTDNVNEYYQDVKDYRNLRTKEKKLENELSDLKYTDSYEQFRSDIYKIAGKSTTEANFGGTGMALDNQDALIAKYINNLKGQGYDGIIIKGTNYDSGRFGENNNQYVAFNSNQIKNVDNLNPTTNEDIRYSSNNQTWQEHLEENYPGRGTRTNMQNIKLPIAQNFYNRTNSKKYSLDETQKKQINELDNDIQKHIEKYKKQYPNDKNMRDKKIKGYIMQAYAKRRELIQGNLLIPVEGGLTESELARKIEKLRSNYVGKNVVVEGKNGKVIGNSFGKVGVEFEDGTQQYFEKSQITPVDDIDKIISDQKKKYQKQAKIPTAQDIQRIENNNTKLPNLNKLQNPLEISKLTQEDANTAPPLPNIKKNKVNDGESKNMDPFETFSKEFSEEIKKIGIDKELNLPLPKDPTKESSYDIPSIQKIAKILDSKPETPQGKQNKLKTWLATKILDKGYYIDKIARQYKNRELSAKYDYMLAHNNIANQIIGNGRYDSKGNKIGKSLNEIFIPIENANLVKEFSEYVYHKHNVDRMILDTTYKEANKPVFGESITADKSAKIAYEYEQQYPEFKKWAKEIYDYNNANLQMLVDNGVISPENKNYYNQKYPHYVPIVRDNGYTRNAMIKANGKDIMVGSPIKKATGGSSNILPLKEAMAMNTMKTVSSSLKNDFGQELLKTLYSSEYKNLFDNNTDIDSVVDSVTSEDVVQSQNSEREASLTIFDGGNKLTLPISEEIYEALSPRDVKTFKSLNKLNNIRRALLTEYSPAFMITNPIKDIQDGLINSQHPSLMLKNIPEAISQIKAKGTLYKLYMANGGGYETYFNYDNGTNVSNSTFYKKTGNKLIDTISIPLKVLDKISSMNQMIEMTPRLAEFIGSIEAGDSIQTAMYNAQEITTNFKRGGDVTKTLDKNGVTFLNAGVQGMLKQARNIQDAKVNGIRGITNLAVKFAVTGLSFALLNDMIWGDDDEYEDLSDYIKNNYYIVGKGKDGKFIRIPKGRVTSIIQKFFQNIVDLSKEEEVDIEGFINLLQNQILPNDPTENNLLSPLLQAFGSENGTAWYGGDLVPSRLQDLPAAEQYDESTDSISIWLGKALNISPYKINYVLDQYSGAIGDFILPYLTEEAESPSVNVLGQIVAPINDKFVTDSVLKNQNVSDIYDLSDDLQKKSNSIYALESDKLKYKYISSITSKMGTLYSEKREIQSSTTLNDTEKYNRAKEIQRQINELAKNGLQNYDNVSLYSNYGKIGDKEYFFNSKKSWEKIDEEESEKLESLNMSESEKNTYFKYKMIANEVKSDDNTASNIKREKIANIVIESGLSDDKMAYLYSCYYSSEKTLEDMMTLKIPIKEFIKFDSQEFTTNYDSSGKAITNSKKNKIINYINSLNLSIPQKAILIKSQYSSYDSYNKQIVNYVNSQNLSKFDKATLLKSIGFDDYNIYIVQEVNSRNISAKEKEEILDDLGFKIVNGRVYW